MNSIPIEPAELKRREAEAAKVKLLTQCGFVESNTKGVMYMPTFRGLFDVKLSDEPALNSIADVVRLAYDRGAQMATRRVRESIE